MDKRFFLALFLSLIVIAVSQLLFPPAKKPPTATSGVAKDSLATKASKSDTVPSTTASSTLRGSPPKSTASAVAAVLGDPGRSLTESTPETTEVVTTKATYKFTNLGAAPVSIVLRDYANRSTSGGRVDLAAQASPLLSYQLVTPTDTADLSRVVFAVRHSTTNQGEHVLTYETSVRSLAITLTYTISTDTVNSYVVRVNGSVRGAASPAYLLVQMPKTLRSAEADTVADLRSLAYSFKPDRDHARSLLFSKLDSGEKTLEAGPLSWVAVKSKYFVLGIIAPASGGSFSEVSLVGGPRTGKLATTASATVVDALRNDSFAFDIYAGPQESQRLAQMGRDFDHVNPYGWRFLQGVVHPIASKVIEAVVWMHRRLNLSYGWVLVILGILIRLALWPLNQSTMRSSLKMQELQPKLAAAQKKYKDPVQQREAIMKVYQEAGVSPFAGLTGCLPALLPMPILFALFFVFQNTIEFRGVPFLWLHDISVRDPLYILPLLMGVSMYVLSWIGMRNAPPNPQAKMMGYMFPVMMTVVLLNMASGLNLYYTAQNIAALPQQWFLARERARIRPTG
jgi:YidC/Oxa1 family membrane protein insertase